MNALLDSVADHIAKRISGRIVLPRLLDVEQTALYLGRTEKGIRQLYAAGKLLAVKIDGRLQFDREDLDRCIESSKK